MVAFNKFQSFVEAVAEKVHNLGADTLKAVLTNTAPQGNDDTLGDITEIANGNGYTTGGVTVSQSSSSQTSGTYKLVVTDPTPWTASGGTIGPFRYVVLYNDTATNNELIGYWDYGSSITLNAGESFTVDFDGTNGALQIVYGVVGNFNKFNSFVEGVAEKAHNLGADTLKVVLISSAPSATNAGLEDVDPSEVANGNGYTAGGNSVSIVSSAQTSGTYKLVVGDTSWTASGGTIGPFRYAVLYNDTSVGNYLIGWYDYGSSVTLGVGESFTVDFNGTNGVLQLV
jgi:hypothetical protein